MLLRLNGTPQDLLRDYETLNTSRLQLHEDTYISIDLQFDYEGKQETISVNAFSPALWVTHYKPQGNPDWLPFEGHGGLGYKVSDHCLLDQTTISVLLHTLNTCTSQTDPDVFSAGKAMRENFLISVFLSSEAVRSMACRNAAIKYVHYPAELQKDGCKWENYRIFVKDWNLCSKTIYDAPYQYVDMWDLNSWVMVQEREAEGNRHKEYKKLKNIWNYYFEVLRPEISPN